MSRAAGSSVRGALLFIAAGCAYGNEVAPSGGSDASGSGATSSSSASGGEGGAGAASVGAAGPGGAGGEASAGGGGGCACVEGQACSSPCGTQGALSCATPCAPSCVAPAEACNALDDDCDASCDEDALVGCRVGVHRAYGDGGHLFTTDLAQASSWGMLEGQNNFYLYAAANGSVVPLYRCAKSGTSNSLLTTNAACEGVGTQVGTVGFLSSTAVCGSVPMHRLHLPTENWHFYTLSDAERDSAVAGGWVSEGLAGFVWTAP